MDNALKKASNFIKVLDKKKDIEESFFNSKTSIEKDSVDYKFFFYAINAISSRVAELMQNDSNLRPDQKENIYDIAGIVNLMAAHVDNEDKTQYIE